jgi:hypothetical protein
MSSFIPIASQTLSSSASTVTFSSIPSSLTGKTLRDLVLVGDVSDLRNTQIRINGIDSGIYNQAVMFARGSGASFFSLNGREQFSLGNADSGVRSNFIMHFFDFTQTNKNKSCLARSNSDNVVLYAQTAATTSAITSITIFTATSWAAGSTFNLFGVEG